MSLAIGRITTSATDALGATRANAGATWSGLVRQVETQLSRIGNAGGGIQGSSSGRVSPAQLGELLRLQVELHRCQVKVELLSKVSESASAAFRKLEQTQ